MQGRELWEAVDNAQRLARTYAGEWRSIGSEVVDAEGKPICRCTTAWAATLIATTHNLFLPVTNTLMMQKRKLADRENMRRD